MAFGINLVETPQTRGIIDQLMNSEWVKREITAKLPTDSWQVLYARELKDVIDRLLVREGYNGLDKHFGVNVRGSNQYGLYVTLYADDLGSIYFYGRKTSYKIRVHENKAFGSWWEKDYKDSDWLRFQIKNSGPTIFAKEVTHPPILALAMKIDDCIPIAIQRTNYKLGMASKGL